MNLYCYEFVKDTLYIEGIETCIDDWWYETKYSNVYKCHYVNGTVFEFERYIRKNSLSPVITLDVIAEDYNTSHEIAKKFIEETLYEFKDLIGLSPYKRKLIKYNWRHRFMPKK